MYYKKEFGYDGEEIATEYLFNLGYSIIARNFTCKIGEIDIIALDQTIKEPEIVFIEVKTRFDTRCGNPAEAVDQYKVRHIYRSAEYFLRINNLENHYARFDVIEILKGKNEKPMINHIKKAILDKPKRGRE